jgi:aconitate hydratase
VGNVAASVNSFGAKGQLEVGDASYTIFRLAAVDGSATLPYSLKVLLENLLRTEDGANITAEHIRAIGNWDENADPDTEIQFTPARVVMQDFTGVPCVVDLATMREAVVALGGDPSKINPLAPAELVIDHSVQVDVFGNAGAFELNVELEYTRNRERYQFLRWGQTAFDKFKVVPPGTGIVHQVNIERLARVIFPRGSTATAWPTPTPAWAPTRTPRWSTAWASWAGASAASRPRPRCSGQPVSMLIPRVVGFKLTGKLPEGVTATDLVLTITDMLRKHGVVGKFVEFYGEACRHVPLANRATIANMSPEFGSTCAIFPIDAKTIDYLRLTGRAEEPSPSSRPTPRTQGLWHDDGRRAPLQREARARPVHGRPVHRRPEASAGPHRAVQGQGGLLKARRCRPTRATPASGSRCTLADGRSFELFKRRGVHRVDHLVHQHVQPVGDDRRRVWSPRRPPRRAWPASRG